MAKTEGKIAVIKALEQTLKEKAEQQQQQQQQQQKQQKEEEEEEEEEVKDYLPVPENKGRGTENNMYIRFFKSEKKQNDCSRNIIL